MPTYAFEAISATQALAITSADTLTFASGPSRDVTVLYDPTSLAAPGGTITIVAAGRTVVFGYALAGVSLAGRLQASDGSRLFIGDDGENTASASGASANDALYGGPGRDILEGGLGDDLLQGNQGSDYLVGGGGRDVIYGGQDNDLIRSTIAVEPGMDLPANDGADFAQGNKGNDTIEGGHGADTLLGGQGNDLVVGFDGANILNGNLGDDFVGGQGALYGEDGNDTLAGSGTSDTLLGGEGDDQISSLGAYIEGGGGNDRIAVGAGAGGANTVFGGDGADTISAEFASQATRFDHVFSGDLGNDSFVGSIWADTISGGEGNDTISGLGARLTDHDRLSGGAGQDLFIIWTGAFDGTGLSLDPAWIMDWQSIDRIEGRYESLGPGTSTNYREIVADSIEAAYASARDLRTTQGVTYVAVQVGVDVVLFGISPSSEQTAVVLVGRTLNDIAFDNIV